METICKNCGAVISDTANFCTRCGTRIEKDTEQRSTSPNPKEKPLFESMSIYYRLSPNPSVLCKIEKKVRQYNAKAEKKTGYDKIDLDMDTLTIRGSFSPKAETEDMSYFRKVLLAGENGDMQGDFRAIRKLCEGIMLKD